MFVACKLGDHKQNGNGRGRRAAQGASYHAVWFSWSRYDHYSVAHLSSWLGRKESFNRGNLLDPCSAMLLPGKTTVLRNLLQNTTLKIGCVVNDVASVNIDAKLIRCVAVWLSRSATANAAQSRACLCVTTWP